MPTPLHRIRSTAADRAGVQWLIKRDDLIHPQISGNKWRKLKYNLLAAREQAHRRLLTFGGAYSNHLYAVAAAGRLFGFDTVGIVRGEAPPVLSPTLQFARSCGMKLIFWPRKDYAEKHKAAAFAEAAGPLAPFYIIPEGGTNVLAVRGCAEIPAEINEPFDYLCCAAGTGGTLAGLIAGCHERGRVVGFPVLKGGGFLEAEVAALLQEYRAATASGPPPPGNWHLETGYHFGGYAKNTPALRAFMHRFEQENGFLLDPVYTAKLLAGIEDLIGQGRFRRGETVVALHTGGVQGREPAPSFPG